MRMFRCLLLGLGLGLVQGSLETAWSLGGPPPDLLLVCVLLLGFRRRTAEAMVTAFFGGLVLDAVALTEPIGIQSLIKVTVAYLPEWAYYVFLPETRLTGWILVIGGTLIQQILLLTLIQTLNPGAVWGGRGVLETVILMVWNLACWTTLSALFAVKDEPSLTV